MIQPLTAAEITATEITGHDRADRITDRLLAIRDACRHLHGDLWPARRKHLLRYIADAMDARECAALAAAITINNELAAMPDTDPGLRLAILAAAVDYIEGECELPPVKQRDDDTRTDA